MPEIPEIETVRYHLDHYVRGKTVSSIDVLREKSINLSPQELAANLRGQQITQIRRRAKILIISFGNNTSLVVHFMLDGYARFFYPHEIPAKQPSVLLTFTTGERLGFFAINLGYIHFYPTTELTEIPELENLGPEPLSPDFTLARFENLLAQRRGMIKPLLMDQSFIAGIGNVYSNEILFCSRILPTRQVAQITGNEIGLLYNCLQSILRKAIAAGGVNDEKFASDDALTGGYEPHLLVAYRTGEACYNCGTAIETKRVGGRNAFFCPQCQH